MQAESQPVPYPKDARHAIVTCREKAPISAPLQGWAEGVHNLLYVWVQRGMCGNVGHLH